MRVFLCFILVILLSCGTSPQQETSKIDDIEPGFVGEITKDSIVEMDSSTQFLTFHRRFISALLGDSDSELDQFFHPEYGVHIIHSFSGAIPEITQFKKSAYFDHNNDIRKAIEDLSVLVILEPQFEPLPNVVCEDVDYDKMGCFAAYTRNNIEQHPWNSVGKYDAIINTIEVTMVDTYLATFYFSKVEGDWCVTFIDLRIPCSA